MSDWEFILQSGFGDVRMWCKDYKITHSGIYRTVLVLHMFVENPVVTSVFVSKIA